MDPSELLTTTQITELYGIVHKTVQRRVNSGDLKPVHSLPGRTGAHLFSPQDVEREFGPLRDRRRAKSAELEPQEEETQ